MKQYKSYMDRQEISPAVHENLLNLEAGKKSARPWMKYGALAACAALIIGVGAWRLTSSDPGGQTAQDALYPGIKDCYGPGEIPPDSATQPPLLHLDYGKAERSSDVAYSIALPEGSFSRNLTKEDLISLFGEGNPLNTQLGWEDAEISGSFFFTAEGKPWEGTVTGRRITGSGNDFYAVLTLAPDALPLRCTVSPADGVTQCWGVEVTGRYGGAYGEGSEQNAREVWLPESREVEFLAHGVGFRLRVYGQEGEGEHVETLVSRFVRYAIADGGVDLSCLIVAPEDIPAWREESFSTLAQARQEADFAPYLPAAEPEDDSAYAGNKDFYGRLSYQEGSQNRLFVRWSRGYDNVEVAVYREGYHSYHLVSPDAPETYDLGLYPIPWCDSVPEEHRETVSHPAFRAEDMSLAIVEARGREHDTGGMTYSFDVLHPDGTVVSYRCDGLTAQQVWAMVEETF